MKVLLSATVVLASLAAPAFASDKPQEMGTNPRADLRLPHICGFAGGSCRNVSSPQIQPLPDDQSAVEAARQHLLQKWLELKKQRDAQ